MYQRVGPAAMKKDLGNTLALCKHLGNPESQFKSIHIAGTNGKGSVAHMLASVCQEAGLKVGLYTSPHLVDFRERIKINGAMVPESFVIDFTEKIQSTITDIQPSFFELTVAMAFDYFAKQQIDITIIETGLGGRLDSTNVITPLISVITNIGYDHTDMLGETLGEIAGEKAGIIKAGVPSVVGKRNTETDTVFMKKATAVGSDLSFAEDLNLPNYTSDLTGSYQVENVRTVAAALNILNHPQITEQHIIDGLKHVVQNTGLAGRWQVIQHQPKVICDTGHNKDGLTRIIEQLESETYNKLHIVFGQVGGKKTEETIELLPREADYYLCAPSVIRGLPVGQLAELFMQEALSYKTFNSVKDAYSAALQNAEHTDLIFVGGSTFVVADFLAFIQSK
jgi:dihydrofolate synthase/folylpolyglutamate synthase